MINRLVFRLQIEVKSSIHPVTVAQQLTRFPDSVDRRIIPLLLARKDNCCANRLRGGNRRSGRSQR